MLTPTKNYGLVGLGTVGEGEKRGRGGGGKEGDGSSSFFVKTDDCKWMEGREPC